MHPDERERTLIVEGFDENTTTDILELVFEDAAGNSSDEEDAVESILIQDQRAVVVLATTESEHVITYIDTIT